MDVLGAPTFIRNLAGVTATNSIPTLSTDGVAVPGGAKTSIAHLRIDTTDTVTIALYGYVASVDEGAAGWCRLGTFDLTDSVNEAHLLNGAHAYTRLACVVTAIAGTVSTFFGFTR